MKVTVCATADDQETFLRDWDRLCHHVRQERSDFVLLPEMPFYPWFALTPNFDMKTWNDAVEAHKRWLRRLPELGAVTVAASCPVNMRGKRLNRGFVWSRQKGVRWVHTKSYLPNDTEYWEASWYQRGDRKFTPVEMPKYKLGFMTCTDIWAMAHARTYGRKGVELLVIPRSTWLSTTDKWISAGVVSAVISGAFCISSNRAVKRGSGTFGGASWVISPDGDILGLTSLKRRFLTVPIDLALADRAKKTYPRDSLAPD